MKYTQPLDQVTNTKVDEMQLKMYVWEDVLRDYTSGMVCILAHNLGEALEVAKKKFDSYTFEDFAGHEYQVITEPDAFYVYGGG